MAKELGLWRRGAERRSSEKKSGRHMPSLAIRTALMEVYIYIHILIYILYIIYNIHNIVYVIYIIYSINIYIYNIIYMLYNCINIYYI